MLTLALGLGANVAIFSLVHAVLLRPLPFAEPDRLVTVHERRGGSRDANIPVSGHEYLAWKEQNRVFERVALYRGEALNITGGGEPEAIRAVRASADFFPLLAVQPALGRVFAPGEDRAGSDRVAILSDGFWRRRFAADGGVLGRNITLDGQAFTVVGVMPPLPQSLTADLWLPIDLPAQIQARGRHNLNVIARLKPDALLAQAQADGERISQRLAEQLPNFNTDHHAAVNALRENLVGDFRPALLMLLASVGLVLLIACANVANLLLTRAAGRQKEIAVRTALGARRWQLARQLLVESTLLAVAGGALGLLLAAWIMDLAPRLAGVDIPLAETARLDWRALALAAALSLLTGIATGVVPALRGSRLDLARWLGEGSRMSDERGRKRLRSALVASEVALALILLVGAGLMINSFVRLTGVDPGFSAGNVLAMGIDLKGPRYAQPEQRRAFYDQLTERLRALPRVQAAGATSHLPLGGADNWMFFTIESRPAPPPGQELNAPFRVVTHDYFRALGIPLLSGRFFHEGDARVSIPVIRWFAQQANPPNSERPQAAPVVIVSEAAARQFWPGEDPLGKRIRVLFSPELAVVGVVGNVKHNALNLPAYPHIYLSHAQEPWNSLSFVVRTAGPQMALADAVRAQVRALDGNLPVTVRAMDDVLSRSVSQQRFNTLLAGAFGGVALALAVVGIFGVVSYSAAQRTAEIGVRMALGAQRRDILRLIVGQGMLPIMAGVIAGAAGALAVTKFIEKLLYGVRPGDPLTFASMAALLTAVAALACYLPARRAARIDPLVALRHQ